MEPSTSSRSHSSSSTVKRSPGRRRPSFIDSDPPSDDDDSSSRPTERQSYAERLNSLLGTTNSATEEDEDDSADFRYDGADGHDDELARETRQSWLDETEEDDEKGSIRAYDDTLRDILGEEGFGEDEDEGVLDRGEDELEAFGQDRQVGQSDDGRSDRTPSTSSRTAGLGFSASFSPTSHGAASPSGSQTSSASKMQSSRRPPFLHPTVSRLRSHMRNPSSSSSIQTTSSSTNGANGVRGVLPRSISTSSHFSQLSRTTSSSTIHSLLQPPQAPPSVSSASSPIRNPSSRLPPPAPKPRAEDAFHYTSLKRISAALYPPPTSKASAAKLAALGVSAQERERYGKPVMMAVGGMICVGTDKGWVGTWAFGGDGRGWYGNENISKDAGPVTALALSPDHTYLAVGHAQGHLYLYQLNLAPLPPAPPPSSSSRSSPSPSLGGLSTPTRSALPVQLASALAGKREGHLLGTRILHLGFVGKRHTAIVSGDERGMAFYHSLGRVLGVDSTDVLRILGSYPTESSGPSPAGPKLKAPPPTTLYAASPLPLGPHASDTYQLSALLTPSKLVIVGLKPSPRTWFRKLRERSASSTKPDGLGGAVWRTGSEATAQDPLLAYWWGSVVRFVSVRVVEVAQAETNGFGEQGRAKEKKGSESAAGEEVKRVEFPEGGRWEAEGVVRGVQWLTQHHLLVLTSSALSVLDTRTMERVERSDIDYRILVQNDFYADSQRHRDKANRSTVASASDGLSPRPSEELVRDALSLSASSMVSSVQGSFSTYKGKVFFLTKADVRTGSIVSWSDRLLALIGTGDMLGAIRLATSFYLGLDRSTVIGLPESTAERQKLVGSKLEELVRSSLRYVFSDDRMSDNTHDSRDGRGVDRTELFEGLVTETAEASLALGDLDFLLDDVFDRYEQAGIEGIFLSRLEPFILDGRIQTIPTNVVQRLFRLRDARDELDELETLIWHVDSRCLDINQAITLCHKHRLWDALVHVYNRSLADFVSPVVELLAIVRTIQHHRSGRPQRVGGESRVVENGHDRLSDDEVEALVPDAYKLYSYLSEVLSGLAYPSREQMPDSEAIPARTSVYAFLFSGRTISAVPSGPLVATVPKGGSEPTYPYLRLLLQFDTEAFLHAMDIAFEDPYLNDDTGTDKPISRQLILNLMLDVALHPTSDGSSFFPSDLTLLYIFVARNLPKYPQFVILPPSTLHRILEGLTTDPDQSTREDRQLAAEYLLSAYTPHDPDRMLVLFESAGFFRILRATYRAEKRWAALVGTYLGDPEAAGADVFASVDEVLSIAGSPSSSSLPSELKETLLDAIPHLSELGVRQTALLVDRHLPSSHRDALQSLASSPHKQFGYLRCLLEPARTDEEEDSAGPLQPRKTPSTELDAKSRHLYVSLLARHDPSGVVRLLEDAAERNEGLFDLSEVISICEDLGPPEAVVWALDRQGHTRSAFAKVGDVIRVRGAEIAAGLESLREGDVRTSHQDLQEVRNVTRMGVGLCLARSGGGKPRITAKSKDPLPVEDMWFGILHELIELVHAVSGLVPSSSSSNPRPPPLSPILDASPPPPQPLDSLVLDSLRALVQETLSALLSSTSSSSSTNTLSFPNLFKQLVSSTTTAVNPSPTSPSSESDSQPSPGPAKPARAYSEFRTLLTGMLDSSKTDAELLSVTIRLVERDLFETVEELARKRGRGWRAECENGSGTKTGTEHEGGGEAGVKMRVWRSGKVERVVEEEERGSE